jgi:type II secretory pathway component GspD/PulD (secretin)
LQDIPLLGALFSSRSTSKSRQELLVLLRPTVLKTPEIAAAQAKKEQARLPGIAHLESQDTKDELKQVQAEERLEKLQDEKDAKAAAKTAARDAAKAKRNGTSVPATQTNAPAMDAAPSDSAPDAN